MRIKNLGIIIVLIVGMLILAIAYIKFYKSFYEIVFDYHLKVERLVVDSLRFQVDEEQVPLSGMSDKLILRDQLGRRWLFKFGFGEVAGRHSEMFSSYFFERLNIPYLKGHCLVLPINEKNVEGRLIPFIDSTQSPALVDYFKKSNKNAKTLLSSFLIEWVLGAPVQLSENYLFDSYRKIFFRYDFDIIFRYFKENRVVEFMPQDTLNAFFHNSRYSQFVKMQDFLKYRYQMIQIAEMIQLQNDNKLLSMYQEVMRISFEAVRSCNSEYLENQYEKIYILSHNKKLIEKFLDRKRNLKKELNQFYQLRFQDNSSFSNELMKPRNMLLPVFKITAYKLKTILKNYMLLARVGMFNKPNNQLSLNVILSPSFGKYFALKVFQPEYSIEISEQWKKESLAYLLNRYYQEENVYEKIALGLNYYLIAEKFNEERSEQEVDYLKLRFQPTSIEAMQKNDFMILYGKNKKIFKIKEVHERNYPIKYAEIISLINEISSRKK